MTKALWAEDGPTMAKFPELESRAAEAGASPAQVGNLKIMVVAAPLHQVGLVDVIGPHGIECRDVAGHPRHEASQQRCQSKAEHSMRIVTVH